ncbi:hypothetical protein IWX49DRAFT_300118 [Phyllosticta citricarpa]|uniref:Uncharacterized protein n=2 Tax=Phyllosticta TaxID=121621 RepID=A0ABR1LGW6_9PEZI
MRSRPLPRSSTSSHTTGKLKQLLCFPCFHGSVTLMTEMDASVRGQQRDHFSPTYQTSHPHATLHGIHDMQTHHFLHHAHSHLVSPFPSFVHCSSHFPCPSPLWTSLTAVPPVVFSFIFPSFFPFHPSFGPPMSRQPRGPASALLVNSRHARITSRPHPETDPPTAPTTRRSRSSVHPFIRPSAYRLAAPGHPTARLSVFRRPAACSWLFPSFGTPLPDKPRCPHTHI